MPNYSCKPQRILIVDDEATLVFFLSQSLQEINPAYVVTVVSSGEEALTQLTYQPYDVLITDLKMPGISGFTLTESARSLYPDIKVVIMTAFGAAKEVQQEVKNLKVDGYLTKPFPTSKLCNIVVSLLEPENNVLTPSAVPANPQKTCQW